eukprot:GEMP01030992.1.p1 GENE.GEMP01030992.1~~GEMP01030992.1.p1  ORF type:complete len:181 (+),score=37.09 GEMP01030992.1:66-545(+)
MLRLALISLSVYAETDAEPNDLSEIGESRISITQKQTEIPIISDETIGDLFDKYPRRFVVSVAEDDFSTISNKDSKESKALVDCSGYFFDQYEKPEERFMLLLLNSSQESMIDDASTYLNCKEKPCYSLELEDTQGEDAEGSGSKAYTRSIKDFGSRKK